MPPDNSKFMVAGYTVVCVIYLVYSVMLLRKSRR